MFQIESGYGLLRLLHIEGEAEERVWHLSAFNEMFLDIDMADAALADTSSLTERLSHVALTTRAFEATQVARMKNEPLAPDTESLVRKAIDGKTYEVSDRSIRLMLGLR